KERAALNRDVVLYYSVSPKDVGMSLVTHRVDPKKDGYFMLMASPKTTFASKEMVGKTITFVVDTSGSMRGAKMRWAKKALLSCLSKLNAQDTFNVLRFSSDVEPLFAQPVRVTPAHVEKAKVFVGRMAASGATAIEEALSQALAQKSGGADVRLVVFLTDGHPTVGETQPKRLSHLIQQRNKSKTRIFTFGIGSSINVHLLDKIAQASGGAGDYVAPNREVQTRISTFYDKVRYPVLHDVKMTVRGPVRLRDFYPRRLPDLFRGGQLLVMGRYRGTGHVSVTLTGKVNGQPRMFVYEARLPVKQAEHDFLPKLWGHRKVANLLDTIRMKGELPELKREVIRLAKKFGIVTPYTSYLVVEKRDRWRLKDSARPLKIGRRPRRRRHRSNSLNRGLGRLGSGSGRSLHSTGRGGGGGGSFGGKSAADSVPQAA
ncbi:MAG: VWA domain-containing protein, partial [Myxococcota bacterium]